MWYAPKYHNFTVASCSLEIPTDIIIVKVTQKNNTVPSYQQYSTTCTLVEHGNNIILLLMTTDTIGCSRLWIKSPQTGRTMSLALRIQQTTQPEVSFHRRCWSMNFGEKCLLWLQLMPSNWDKHHNISVDLPPEEKFVSSPPCCPQNLSSPSINIEHSFGPSVSQHNIIFYASSTVVIPPRVQGANLVQTQEALRLLSQIWSRLKGTGWRFLKKTVSQWKKHHSRPTRTYKAAVVCCHFIFSKDITGKKIIPAYFQGLTPANDRNND